MHVYLVKFFIVLNVRDGTESKYPSIVFLSIHSNLENSCPMIFIFISHRKFVVLNQVEESIRIENGIFTDNYCRF